MEICGYVERITFRNVVTGYVVLKLQEHTKKRLITVVGIIPSIQPGETLRCQGTFSNHLIHGEQFEVESYSFEVPSDAVGIKKYLGSMIKGIGPVYAGKIVDHFGPSTLTIIEKSPARLCEVPGLGKKRLEMIVGSWNDQRAIREVMIFLQGHGISPTFAQKIHSRYGSSCIDKIKEDPYCLAREVHGIGFRSADLVAQKMGIEKQAPVRIDAGIEFLLSELADEGHVCYPIEPLLPHICELLEIEEPLIRPRIDALIGAQKLIKEPLNGEEFLWIKPLYFSERGIARELARLKRGSSRLRKIEAPKAIAWAEAKLGIALADNQKVAVTRALEEKVQVITGGPGTGKSTITNAIITILAVLTEKILLAAPTGRAAKRMSEITGHKATTIHSLLEYEFGTGRFKHNKENPLDCDLIIVDEASMIDTQLMYSLLKALPDHARLILVGDINQLPSVGPGNVLKDIIGSASFSVTMLNEIFRQAAGSRIITNSHKINSGIMPDTRTLSDSDFFFIEANEPDQVMAQILSLVKERLPKRYGFDPFRSIQVLAPMKKGIIGIENLNSNLQKALNPSKAEPLVRAGKELYCGDKVMQTRNNYRKEVFNGDVGFITAINYDTESVTIDFDERTVDYGFNELDELSLAYAVSVHKYQGSECACVVIPVHTTHFKMLRRTLLYTGVTRGKKLVVLVGTQRALAIAVRNDEVSNRYTALQQMLTEALHPL